MIVCKEKEYIHTPLLEKSKYLSVRGLYKMPVVFLASGFTLWFLLHAADLNRTAVVTTPSSNPSGDTSRVKPGGITLDSVIAVYGTSVAQRHAKIAFLFEGNGRGWDPTTDNWLHLKFSVTGNGTGNITSLGVQYADSALFAQWAQGSTKSPVTWKSFELIEQSAADFQVQKVVESGRVFFIIHLKASALMVNPLMCVILEFGTVNMLKPTDTLTVFGAMMTSNPTDTAFPINSVTGIRNVSFDPRSVLQPGARIVPAGRGHFMMLPTNEMMSYEILRLDGKMLGAGYLPGSLIQKELSRYASQPVILKLGFPDSPMHNTTRKAA